MLRISQASSTPSQLYWRGCGVRILVSIPGFCAPKGRSLQSFSPPLVSQATSHQPMPSYLGHPPFMTILHPLCLSCTGSFIISCTHNSLSIRSSPMQLCRSTIDCSTELARDQNFYHKIPLLNYKMKWNEVIATLVTASELVMVPWISHAGRHTISRPVSYGEKGFPEISKLHNYKNFPVPSLW